MVQDTPETINEEPLETAERGDDFIDTASDLKDLSDNINSGKNNTDKKAADVTKDAENTTEGAEDVTKGAQDIADETKGVTKKAGGMGRGLAEEVGGEIGRGVGEDTAAAIGADEDLGGDVGEEGGSAAGGYLHDQLANKGASAGNAGGAGTTTAAGGAGTAGTAATAAEGATATEAGVGAAGAATAGTAAATGGAEAATVAGAGVAGAGETAGVSLAVAAAAIAAQEAKKQADKKTPGQKALYAIIILTILALPLIIILITVSAVVPRLSFDKDDPVSKATVASIETMSSSGKIEFTNKREDLKKIRSGEIGKPALDTINNLGKSHEYIAIHYTGVREYAPGLTKTNDSFEFDITAVDKIKCTDTANSSQLIEFPIYLNLNYDWKSLVLPSYSDKIICAVGYYPTINSPISTTYKDLFSPGEFPIQELPERAKMAVQEKTAELIDEIISQDRLLGIDSTSSDSLLPVKMTLDSTMMSQNFKNSTTAGISSALGDRIKQAYKAPYPDKPYNPLETINNYNGLHVSYL